MRTVPGFDLFFIVLHALLIPLVGLVAWLVTGFPVLFALALALLVVYLLLALRRPLRRRKAAAAPFPGEWRELLLSGSPFYRGLDGNGRTRFERDVRLFLIETRIAGSAGTQVAWPTRLLIAAGAATMLHGRPDWEPPLRDGVTVYPGFVFDRNYRPGRGRIAGQAPARGPLLVAEKTLLEGFANERDGYNVIIHELAHYFDLEARQGGLHIVTDSALSVPWGDAVKKAYQRHDFAASPLPDYAASNEAEFVACASEMFFEDPDRLGASCPRLFSLLEEFYGQDPRAVLRTRAV